MIVLCFPARESYKRTVKKYEGIRNRRFEKESKHRNERKTSQGISNVITTCLRPNSYLV